MIASLSFDAFSACERLYLLCLRADLKEVADRIQELYRTVGDAALWDFAGRDECQSIVAHALRSVLEPEGVPGHWRDAAAEVERTLTLYLSELERVAADLRKHDIPLIALKNSGIAKGIYPHLAACPMGDVDVLVSPEQFREAHKRLLELGFRLGDRSPFDLVDFDEASRHGGTEYTVPLSDGSSLWFELQWRPVAGRWIRPDQEPPAADLIERSVPIPGSAVRLLAPEDNLLQVCLHTAKHSYVRAPGFRLHTDVDRIVRFCEIDWDRFLIMTESIGVKTAVFLSLFIPRSLLESPIPDSVLNRLNHAPRKHRLMLRWLRKAGLFDPNRKKWSKPGYILFTLLLYDDFRGILSALFPPETWMRQRYPVRSAMTLPYWYLRRGLELLFKRANT
jgi:hypothetical protein